MLPFISKINSCFWTHLSGAICWSSNRHLLPSPLPATPLCSSTWGNDEHPDPAGPNQGIQEGQGGEDRGKQVRGWGQLKAKIQKNNTKIQMTTKPKGSRTKARESSTRGLPATGSVPGWRTWTSPSSRLVQQPSMTILQPWLNLAFCRFSWWTVPRSCGSDSPSSSLLAKDSPRLSRSGWPSSTSSTWSTCSGREVFLG